MHSCTTETLIYLYGLPWLCCKGPTIMTFTRYPHIHISIKNKKVYIAFSKKLLKCGKKTEDIPLTGRGDL